ncbi:MAG: hypothetical protein JKX84_08760 [Flavobacteriales bacterium]|nr:hypothetical protein [Flavobacteriales bacterium]
MKTNQITPFLLLLATTFCINSYAQNNPYWMVGGNPTFGVDAVTSNQSIGTVGAFNFSLRTANSTRLTIKGDGTNDGFVGIGTTTPTSLLDVAGDINLSNATDFYRIQGMEVLYSDSTNYNLAIGALHDMNSLDTAERNIMIGRDCGSSLTFGFYNNFLGYQAGMNTTTGNNNAFIGECAGRANTTGKMNTHIGAFAGLGGTTANHNTTVR